MLTQQESLAVVRLMIQAARSDGTLSLEETVSIREAFEGIALPEGQTMDALLAEPPVAVDALGGQLTSPESRMNAFRSVYVLAHADGAFTDQEKQFVEALRARLDIPTGEVDELNRELTIVENMEGPLTSAGPVQGTDRASRVQALTRKYCILTALSGAVPVPLVGDLLVIPMQMKMVYEIGKVHEQEPTKTQIKSMLGALGVGTGARLAVSSISKLIPGWGSFVGASAAYATTYALGHTAARYFESGGKDAIVMLKGVFQEKRVEGKQRYETDKDAIAQQKDASSRLEALGRDLKEGRLTQAQYDQAVNDLLQKV